jgi:Dolichyl-phosphate-mannose-protein mannosyltransferase
VTAQPRLRQIWQRAATPEGGVVLVVLVFLAISAWWLATDLRVVNLDNGKHLRVANDWYLALKGGHLLQPLLGYADYPPGPHLVGAIAGLIFGPTLFVMTFAHNLLFVPLLALGCYGTGRIAFGRTAGLLAALFALSVPLLMAMFHQFLPDGPMTAMVAVTVWLLLATDRFERIEISALAGVALGLGMYTKGTFVAFVIGVVAVMLARGGWRNWRGLVAFGLFAWAIAVPWYFAHYYQLHSATTGAITERATLPHWYGNVPFPTRGSIANYTWYAWSLVNNTLYLPLTLFLVGGIGWAGRALVVSRRWRESYLPELLVGGFAGYLAMSLLVLKDPRYTLPCLVYIAVLATGWIVELPRRPRLIATGVLVAVFAFNTVQHNFGIGGSHRIALPGWVNSPIGEYSFVWVNDAGYSVAKPVHTGRPILDLLEDLRGQGVRRVVFDPNTLNFGGGYNMDGLRALARRADIPVPGVTPEFVTSPQDAWITRQVIADVHRKPCLVSPLAADGTGLYVYRGAVPESVRKAPPDCPQ